jgi:hypothetical protein
MGRSVPKRVRPKEAKIIRSWHAQPNFHYPTLQNTKWAIVTCPSKKVMMVVTCRVEGGAVDSGHNDVFMPAGVT